MENDGGLRLLHISWDDVLSLTEEIARQIRERGYVPDVIVAVSRGGFDPARILCDLLGVKRLASLQIEYYKDINESGHTPEIVFPINADVHDKSILVVDDVSDTGTSLRLARDHVLERGASEVLVATLHVKPWTTFLPDFSASEVESWIVYPWEILESVNSIAKKLELEGLSPSNVRKELLRLGFSRRQVDRMDL
ncbi:phosphoribosyltransferase [Candidatus Bathyarchaeota archaeon]|nr:phosphoribosyltransferase [Candidatus Bathyarchaeota archaeon]